MKTLFKTVGLITLMLVAIVVRVALCAFVGAILAGAWKCIAFAASQLRDLAKDTKESFCQLRNEPK